MYSTNRRDLPHSTPFPLQLGWIAYYLVDFEVRWVIVISGIGTIHHSFLWIQSQNGRCKQFSSIYEAFIQNVRQKRLYLLFSSPISPLMISAENTLCGIPLACKIFTRLRQDVNTVELTLYKPRRYIADTPAQSAIHRWNDNVNISKVFPPVVYCSHFIDDPRDYW